MKKQIDKSRTLRLARETMRQLSSTELRTDLARVAGGNTYILCTIVCPTEGCPKSYHCVDPSKPV